MEKEYIKVAWSKIFCFFQTVEGIYAGNEANLEKFTEAIFWMARTGAQWRELPCGYGDWNSVLKDLMLGQKRYLGKTAWFLCRRSRLGECYD